MKVICCDTSMLYSLYGNDNHSAKALATIRHQRTPLTITVLLQFEFENALRIAVWRQAHSPAHVARLLAKFTQDVDAGNVVIADCKVSEIINEARRLSNRHTQSEGYRAMDILHVAAAVYLNATEFLSFDLPQRRLAAKVGMKIGP